MNLPSSSEGFHQHMQKKFRDCEARGNTGGKPVPESYKNQQKCEEEKKKAREMLDLKLWFRLFLRDRILSALQ